MEENKLNRRKFIKNTLLTTAAVGTLVAGQEETVQAATTSGQFPHRSLGRTGATIPIMQLGTSQRMDPHYDKVLHLCYREGVTAIDTALSYGWGASHRAVANFMGQVKNRKKLWITSKSHEYSPKGLTKDIDNALKELKTDYLDLYLMHGIEDLSMLDRQYLKAGENMKKSGKTRFFGFSCHDDTVVELMNKAAKSGGIDAILFRYNFRRYGDLALNRAIDACHKAGIGLIAMKTNGGVSRSAEKVLAFKSRNFTLDQAKLKSVWADERISSLLSEMDSLRVARENIAAAKSPHTLSASEAHQLNQLAALTAPEACQGCKQFCEGATGHQAAIADSMRFMMYHEVYGDPDRARRLFGELPRNRRNFDGLDLAAASAACPQGINLAEKLPKALELLG